MRSYTYAKTIIRMIKQKITKNILFKICSSKCWLLPLAGACGVRDDSPPKLNVVAKKLNGNEPIPNET